MEEDACVTYVDGANGSEEAAAVVTAVELSPSSPPPLTKASPAELWVPLTRGGTAMPMVGLGTFRCKGKTCRDAVTHAIKRCGIRLIDTAEGYKNEADVAAGIAASGIPRKEIFIVTKVSKDSMKSPETVRKAILSSLKNLSTDYIDLLLVHWPGTATSNPKSPLHAKARLAAWKVFEEFAQMDVDAADPTKGKVVHHIGVSNFTVEHLEQLLQSCTIRPEVNQIECHPYWRQEELRRKCKELGIHVQAYTSLGRCTEPPKVLYGIREPDHPRLVKDDRVIELSKRCQRTPPQVLLRWALQHGLSVIPKAGSIDHITENFVDLSDQSTWIDEEGMKVLDTLLDAAGFESEVRYAYPAVKVPI